MKPTGLRFRSSILFLYLTGFFLSLISCNNITGTKESSSTEQNSGFKKLSPDFNSDSAYAYAKAQVDFGPRIPGSMAHEKCAQYIIQKLKGFGLNSFFQEGEVKAYTGKTYSLKNIIGSFHPEFTKRILLSAHWDTRPFSDQDPIPTNRDKTFDGANDGASGVGILLELARDIQIQNPKIGVDIIFWDIEDYGMKNGDEEEKTWCLGSRYWVSHPPVKGYSPLYNINLDMVGGLGAVFNMEKASFDNDSPLVKSVWDIGNQLGYSSYFSYTKLANPIIDDHVIVQKGTNIPAIDIIDYSDEAPYFYKYWHQQGDNLIHLDKKVIKAVGQTVLENLYQEGIKIN